MNVLKNNSIIDKSLKYLSIIYIFVSFGFTGVPNISRLSFLSSLLMACLLFITKTKIILKPWIILIIFFYLYLLLPSFLLNFIPYEAIFGTITVLVGTTCISLLFVNRVISTNIFAYTVLCASLVNVVAVIIGIDTTPMIYGGFNELRATGFLGNANTLAVNLCLASFAIWMIDEIPFFYKLVSLSSLFYGIIVSGSRKGAIIGFVLVLLITTKRIEDISKVKISIFGLFLFSISYYYVDSIIHIFNLAFDNIYVFQRLSSGLSGQETSFNERQWLYDAGFKIWKDSPIFGEGLGQFAYLNNLGLYSHSNFIEILVSGGILAFVLYYLLYMLIIYYAFRLRRSGLFYAFLIIAMLLFIDITMVSFVSRSNMLFIVFVLWYFSRRVDPKMVPASSGALA